MLALPIDPLREKIQRALAGPGELLLAAPTGSGKSTRAPQFALEQAAGRVLVLEPRRISARSLAARVASERKSPLGTDVGYQVRFDSRCGPRTRLVFQTYGIFVQQLLRDPELSGVSAVLLDEFHERTLESDLSLAWLKTLRRGRRKDLAVAVMSATLDAGELSAYLPAAQRLEAPGRMFPVDVRYRPKDARQGPAEAALEALKDLAREGLDGSALIFMPGLREIRRCLAVLGPFCRDQDLDLRSLHGSQELDEQQAVLEGSGKPRVIVTTNVAETGLTVPGVTMVIDAGLHRLAAYDAARGINTLYVTRISRANAEQRAGRAGRTAPGRCVRLWSRAEEQSMAKAVPPEMKRLELSSVLLQAASLPGDVEWPTPPGAEARAAAERSLKDLGAFDGTRLSARGRALLRYPLPPRLGSVLEEASALGSAAFERACAMAAVFETEGRDDQSADLDALAAELQGGRREELSRDAFEVFRQLKRLKDVAPKTGDTSADLSAVWLRAFPERLAVREAGALVYKLADGRGVALPQTKDPPPLILALDIKERAGGGQAKQVAARLFLPCARSAVEAAYPGEAVWTEVSEFDARLGRVVKESRLLFRGLALERKELNRGREDRKATAELWAEKFASGELRHPGRDEKVEQLLVRIALMRKLYPDMGYPEMGVDDWRLIYGEACAGKNSLKDIERVALEPHIMSYLGPGPAGFLEKALPSSRKLPSGKSGKFFYSEAGRPELSARLGDFLKAPETLSLCEGRLRVVFDILAPNYRTVQKTDDLGSFWRNTYPTVKKELQRRYPRHPWP
jgi:ATP-dependent helicase HrpB